MRVWCKKIKPTLSLCLNYCPKVCRDFPFSALIFTFLLLIFFVAHLFSFSDMMEKRNHYGKKVLLVLCGLPARGKSFTSNKLNRYLCWMGYICKVFNVGNLRRKTKEAGQTHDSNFFDPSNLLNCDFRNKLAMETLEAALSFLMKDGGKLAIHDATNSTKSRRRAIFERCERETNLEVIFIESICTQKEVIESNILLKLYSPDYRDKNPAQALQDFRARLENYEKAYETIQDDEGLHQSIQYIKLINFGEKVIARHISGYLPGQIISFLMNMHLKERPIYLSRHGESVYNVEGRIGGDSSLSNRGSLYAQALTKFLQKQRCLCFEGGESKDVCVFTSSLKRTIETAQHLPPFYNFFQTPLLNELYAGPCENMTYSEIYQEMPHVFHARAADKLRFRYPNGGESYMDVIDRIRPTIVELERISSPLIIIGHLAVLRVVYSYFMDVPLEKVPFVHFPLHTVICLTQKPYGMEEIRYNLDETYEEKTWLYDCQVVKDATKDA
eukprot:Sdes_comp17523_c0_seq1m6757